MNNPDMKMTLFELAAKRHEGNMGIVSDPLRYMLETKSVVGIHPVWLQNLVTRTDLARKVGGFDPYLRFGDDDDFVFRLGCETKLCYVNMPMVLIDRAPLSQRHVGANENWDRDNFRLQMAQYRWEKRLTLRYEYPQDIRDAIKKNLAAVHSGWANWFLERQEYSKARESIGQAARIYLTTTIAAKWALSRCTPTIARYLSIRRNQSRNHECRGIG